MSAKKTTKKSTKKTNEIISASGDYKGTFVVHYKEISEEIVFKFAELGCPKVEVARVCGVGISTLENKYGEIYNAGLMSTKTKLRNKMINKALNENDTQTLLFLAKHMLGMNDRQTLVLEDGREQLEDASTDDLIDIIKAHNGAGLKIVK